MFNKKLKPFNLHVPKQRLSTIYLHILTAENCFKNRFTIIQTYTPHAQASYWILSTSPCLNGEEHSRSKTVHPPLEGGHREDTLWPSRLQASPRLPETKQADPRVGSRGQEGEGILVLPGRGHGPPTHTSHADLNSCPSCPTCQALSGTHVP